GRQSEDVAAVLPFRRVHPSGRREVTVAAHHDLDRGPVATDATDDVTQDLLDFLARWPLAGAQQRQHGPAGRRLEDLDRLEAVAAGMGVEQCKLFDGIRIAEIQETTLLRRLSALGVVPTALDRLAYGSNGEHHPALCVLAEEVLRASAGFVPDVVISFATPTGFLARSWPGALRLHVEAGPYSRNPYPESLFFDHLGMYGRSVIARAPTRLREFTVQPEQAEFVAAFRRHYAAVLETIDPFRDVDLRGPFDRVCLLPLQVSNWYGFDEQVTYRTQFEFLIDVLCATPPDVRVVVTEYPDWGPVIKRSGPGRNLDYLRRTFPNMLFLEAFNSYQSPSQSLVPRVDGVWSVSSNVAYQALLFGRLLGTPPSTHLAGISHTTKFAEFFET